MHSKNLCLSLTSLCLLAAADTALAEDWQYSLEAGMANAPPLQWQPRTYDGACARWQNHQPLGRLPRH
ncbi:hypothetical protein PFLmoz3_04911 [Pseudomonas fluorescens]|uniref:Uncharacterized protein n=1 Tax=Pseudomonas fluorescens TaxID=294 RepID=A0A120G6C3_PSEFL|nr:hypothetical protein PFLmoz3_04911 [Pseudomonas fluorescens]